MKIHLHNAGHMTKMAAMPICGKYILKILFPGTTEPILMKLCMKYQRPKPFLICANYDPALILTYFTTMPNLQLRLTWENVTLMYSLEFIASFDLEFGKCSRLNE